MLSWFYIGHWTIVNSLGGPMMNDEKNYAEEVLFLLNGIDFGCLVIYIR
jgi:hypothetical protein